MKRETTKKKSKDILPKTAKILHEPESLLNNIIDQSPYPMWISDNTGTLIRINKSLLDLLKISEEEVLGRYNILKDNIVAEQGHLPLVKRVFDSGEIAKFEIRYDSAKLKHLMLAHHVHVILDVTIFPIKDANGEITNAVIQHIDITAQKQAEEALRKSAEQYKIITSSSINGFAIIDLNGHIVDVNETFCKMLGYSRDELVNMSIRDIEAAEKNAGIKKHIQKIIEAGSDIFESQHRRKDGKIIDIEINSIYSSQLNLLFNFQHDITERKKLKDLLVYEQQELKLFFNSSPINIFYTDIEGRILRANKSCCETLRTREEDLIGKTVYSFQPPEITQSLIEEDREIFLSGRPKLNIIKQFESETGIIWLQTDKIPTFDARGNVTGLIAFIRDITEHKHAEESLLQTNEKLQIMLDTSPLAIFDLDTEGCVQSIWNPGAEHMFGWTKEDVLGHLSPIVPEESKEDFLKTREQVNSGKVITGMDIRRRRKDGSLIDCSFYASPIFDSQGLITGGMAILADITERKKAEKALQASEERFKHLVESLTDDIYSVKIESDGTFISYNGQRIMAITGYSQEEYNADPDLWLKTIYEEDREIITNFMNRILAGEEDISFEYRLINKNGNIRWVRNTPVSHFENGRLIGYDGLVTDITERKRAEEALLESQNRFKRLVESITDYMYTIKIENGRPVSSSHGPGCITVTGYSPEEFEKEPALWYRLIYENDKQIVKEQIEKILSGQDVMSVEHRIIHKKGSIRWVKSMMVPRFIDGRLASYDGLISDITERKQSEESLRISEEKYRDIFERAMEGIYQTNLEGKFINANPSFAKMLGYDSPQELIDSVSDINEQVMVHPEDTLVFKDTIDNYGAITGFEIEVYKKDRSICWISINAVGIKDNDGKILYFEGKAQDITKNKKAEEERVKLQSQLQQAQKMEAIGTFTGGVAHDFNNILSVLMGYASLLQMEIDKDNPLRIYADQLVSSTKKAADLTQSLLAFSRKQPVNLKPLKLNELIGGTEKLLKRLLTEDIALKKNLSPDEITVMGDASQIDQILFNLATNARDAMPNGGIIFIETKLIKVEGEYIHITGGDKSGTYALLSFSDTGTGIDKKIKDQIFDPFFTTKEVGKGTGLGLSTVYGIVKQHGGFINVYSELDKGTAFHIYFPAAPVTFEEEKPAVVPASQGKERIIIAEDNEAVRLLMKKILTKFGYTIIEAFDGQDAIQKYKNNKDIDLMILDSVMPKKNGREVYDEIVKINPDIKVLFTSGYTRDIILDKGIEEKEVDFISKPITPNELLEKVRYVLDRE